METLGSKRTQCAVCGVYFERTAGVFGRGSKHCPKCSRPKPKSTRDTNAPQVVKNSELLRRAW